MATTLFCRTLAIIPLAGLLLLPGSAEGAVPSPRPLAAAGAIHGVLLDAESGEPVSSAQVRVRELGRSELSHGDGSFHFDRLPAGSFTVVAQRLGYATAEREVTVSDGDTVRLTLELVPSALTLAAVVVTGTGRERGVGEAYRPTTVLDGAGLRRELGSSVAATLAGEPGISQRYNGPAASQPVIRGLGGDRVLVLEDGMRTGDVATTGSDHAVTIDPLTAERIEVVRGPAGLLYGSNALGGVVNVVREEVPRTHPEKLTGTASLQGESVNRGITAGGSLLAPLGPLAVRAELTGRWAGDTDTPLGTLPSTDMDGYSGGVGASWVSEWGYAGVALRDYSLEYGVPGEFRGETIPGAHAGGVRVDLRRSAVRVEAGLFSGAGPFTSLEVDANFVRFEQDEIEPGGLIGTQFGQLLGSGDLIARHEHDAGGVRLEGAAGVWMLGKDFRAAGSSTGTRPAQQFALAGYLFEEFGVGALRLQAGARYDWTRVTPLDTSSSSTLEEVRRRDFGAFSGSLAGLYQLSDGWTVGASVARAFRTPAIEELFSDGPHLASFSYQLGNPDLEPEYGLGADLFVRTVTRGFNAELAVFRNHLTGYIHYRPTGELDPRFREFPVYRADQSDALFHGAEGQLQWEPVRHLVVHGQASFVRARRQDTGEPLPAIPPLHGGAGLRYDRPGWFAGVEWTAAARQDRVGEFEEPTGGYHLLSATGGLRWTLWERLHTLTLGVDNLTDRVWRDHLSRIKLVAPQPGRSVKVLYRVNF
ncbi:MAG: TonB-dependent receptor [Longimicrobiaceae bacterium]